jgi:hypothetical protein
MPEAIEASEANEYQPRYTKVVIEGRGVFIRDNYNGSLYDLITRRIK